ncbi:HD domain-containing protein [Frigidibacter sp. MR17.24]|uniref:HD domain-containing protein n=1 Tax=Frigidibacter sp. MR17.24 TaxID=3127345 RepID=UPI003012CA45
MAAPVTALDPARFPDPGLAAALLPHAFDRRDGAHDEGHLWRVWRSAARIAAAEGGDLRILQAAALLHDCVNLPKTAPGRHLASRQAAARARGLLAAIGWDAPAIDAVAHAIEAHSFSAGIPPGTLEAAILRDADRLDALGFIGVARCFHVAGQGGRAIAHPDDPAATRRPLDDTAFALDHFATKLMGLAGGMLTATGRAMAAERAARLEHFRAILLDELS